MTIVASSMLSHPMITTEIEKHLYVLRKHRPKHHDLWDGDEIHCSPVELEKIQKLKDKGVENFDSSDIDYVIFSSSYTLGSDGTFHYFLPEFFRAYFQHRNDGFVMDPENAFRKLEYCKFEIWPKPSQLAALELCRIGADVEQKEHVDFFEYEDEELNLLIKNIESKIQEVSGLT